MAQWSDIEAKVGQQRSLEERLRDHPELRAKMERLWDNEIKEIKG